MADDTTIALANALTYKENIDAWKEKNHRELQIKENEIAQNIRLINFYSRMSVLSCFNLVESYFNSFAWDFLQNPSNLSSLSNKKRKVLEDTTQVSLNDKILKYPEIILGDALFGKGSEPLKTFVEVVKPFRDSLVHASPFSAPERFGGYDKLRTLYRLDVGTAVVAAQHTAEIIGYTHRKATNDREQYPFWLLELVDLLDKSATDTRLNATE